MAMLAGGAAETEPRPKAKDIIRVVSREIRDDKIMILGYELMYEGQEIQGKPNRWQPVIPSTTNSQGYCPISVLTDLMNDWVIKARVTKKFPIKDWSNGRGKILKLLLVDSTGSDIEAVAFNEAAELYDSQL